MKKILFAFIAALAMFSCSSPNHHVKYDNGNEDFYVHEKNTSKYVITMENGDNTKGTLEISLVDDISKFKDFKYFSNWLSENKGHSMEDAIVRMIKTTWIDAKYQLSNPVTAKFNDNKGTMSLDKDGGIVVFYDVFCKNGMGTEGKVSVCLRIADKNSTDVDVKMF